MNNWFKPINQALIKTKLNKWDWQLLAVVLISFSLGQLQRITISPTISFYAHDALIIIWIVTHIQSIIEYFKQITWQKYWLLLSFMGWVLLGMIFAKPDLVPWLYIMRLVFYTLFVLSLFLTFRKSPVGMRILAASLGLLHIWYGLLQYLIFPDLRFLFTLGWDDHFYRMAGTMLDPNFLGMIIVLTFVYLYSLRKLLPSKLWLGLLAVCVVALTLTFSRSSYLAFAVAVALILFHPTEIAQSKQPKVATYLQRLKYIGAALLIAIGTFLLAPKPGGEGVNLTRTASILARAQNSESALSTLTTQDLILGKGVYSWDILHVTAPTEIPIHARVPDNLLILIIASTGLVGLLLAVMLAFKYLPCLAKTDWLMFTALMAVITHGQFNNTLLEPFVYLLLGMGLVSNTGQTNKPA